MNINSNRITSAFSKFLVPVVIVAVGLAGFLGLAMSRQRPPEADAKATSPLVETALATTYVGRVGIEVNGMVVPYREIVVSSQLDGVVAFKAELCQAGRYVEADPNRPLVQIDRRDYDIEVDRLLSDVTQSETMIEELAEEIKGAAERKDLVEQEVESQKLELDRITTLQGVLSKSDLDQARRSWLSSRNALSVVDNNLRVLQTRQSRMAAALVLANKNLAKARLDAERTDIFAPTNGVIVEERVETGAFVSRGSPLFVFEDTSRAEVQCSLRVDQLARVLENASSDLGPYDLPGNPTRVEFRNGDTSVVWNGKLVRYNGIGLDQKTRTVPCIVEVEEPVSKQASGIRTLVRGMYVKLRIDVEPITQMLEIPAVALVSRDEIWVVKDSRLIKQRVRLARPISDQTESAQIDEIPSDEIPSAESAGTVDSKRTVVIYAIPGRLDAGDEIVTSPPGSIVEGMEVRTLKGELP